jgi:hypothetical protein
VPLVLVFQVTDAQDLYWVKVIRYLLPPIQVVIKSPPSTDDALAVEKKLHRSRREAKYRDAFIRCGVANFGTIESMRFKRVEIMIEIWFLPIKLLVIKT